MVTSAGQHGIYPPGKFFGGSGRRYRGAVPGLPVRDEVTQFADADAAVDAGGAEADGPADSTDGLTAGDILLAVNDAPLASSADQLPQLDLAAAMRNTASKETLLQVRSAEGEARLVLLTPTSYTHWRNLAYDDEISRRRETVDAASDGRLGYLHIRGMNMPSVHDFEHDLYAAAHGKDGLLIDVRDKGKSESKVANDHWLMLGLSYLYLYTGDQRYVDHSFHICRAVEYQYRKNLPSAEKYRDYRGGYYDPPRSTPAATRGEGLVAVLDTCSVAGKRCAWVEELLHETVRHEMLSQYDPDAAYWMKNKPKSFGGWNGGIIDPSIRNDFVTFSAVLDHKKNH